MHAEPVECGGFDAALHTHRYLNQLDAEAQFKIRGISRCATQTQADIPITPPPALRHAEAKPFIRNEPAMLASPSPACAFKFPPLLSGLSSMPDRRNRGGGLHKTNQLLPLSKSPFP
jgi:hypothetical protein